ALLVFDARLPGLQPDLGAGQKTISPVDQSGRRDAILPRRALQIGPTQEFQDDGHFAFGGPAARAGFGGRFRGILSRPMGSLGRPGIVFLRAGHAFSPLEHFLHKMFPMHCPTKSQAGGTATPRFSWGSPTRPAKTPFLRPAPAATRPRARGATVYMSATAGILRAPSRCRTDCAGNISPCRRGT